MNENLESLAMQIDELRGRLLAQEVFLRGALASVEWRNNTYVSKIRALEQDTFNSLVPNSSAAVAFQAAVRAIRAELQI